MAEGSFKKASVVCPFYRNDEKIRRRITCEGIDDESTLSSTWVSERGYNYQLENFCADETFKGCPIYIMLMQQKYEGNANEI